jgi:hypothetical protein
MSPTEDEIRERKKEFQAALKERLTPNLRLIFAAFDVIMVGTVLVDLVFMMGYLGETYLQLLVAFNLLAVVVGYVSFATKRRLSRQVSKELFGEKSDVPVEPEDERASEVTEDNPVMPD